MKRRYWTVDEVEYLAENVGALPLQTIAKKLNRTVTSILSKLTKLGLANTRDSQGDFTAKELARILGISHKIVHRWVNEQGLKARKQITRTKAIYTFIKAEDFWAWAELNKELINFAKIEPKILLPEPSWVNEYRKSQSKKLRVRWTKDEDQTLIQLYNLGWDYQKIGVHMGRNERGILMRHFKIKHKIV